MQAAGNIETYELARTFNCGIGMLFFAAPDSANALLAALVEGPEPDAWVAGRLIEREIATSGHFTEQGELGLLIKTRIAILVSGRGSNMQRLVETCEQQLPSVEIVLVASNKPCAGIDFAAAHGLPTALIDRQTHDSPQAQETALAKTIEAAAADWIFLAGYMAVLSADFVGRFAGRILNIHPSLLPAFKWIGHPSTGA